MFCDTDAASQKIDRCNGYSAHNLTDKTYVIMLIILVFSQLE